MDDMPSKTDYICDGLSKSGTVLATKKERATVLSVLFDITTNADSHAVPRCCCVRSHSIGIACVLEQ